MEQSPSGVKSSGRHLNAGKIGSKMDPCGITVATSSTDYTEHGGHDEKSKSERTEKKFCIKVFFFSWNTTLYNCVVCVFIFFIFWLIALSKEIFSCRIFIYNDSETVRLFPMKVKIIFGTDDLPFGKK